MKAYILMVETPYNGNHIHDVFLDEAVANRECYRMNSNTNVMRYRVDPWNVTTEDQQKARDAAVKRS